MNSHARASESKTRVASTFHVEMIQLEHLSQKLDVMTGLTPERLLGVAYSEAARSVQISYTSSIPTKPSPPHRVPIEGTEAILAICRFPTGVLLYETVSFSPKSELLLADIAGKIAMHAQRRSDANQLFFLGLPNVPTRQKLLFPEGELKYLSQPGKVGITSLRYDHVNGFFIGIRLNSAGRGTGLAIFADPFRRDPDLFLRPDEWENIECNDIPMSIMSLSAPKIRSGETTVLVSYSGGIQRVVRIGTSKRSRTPVWGDQFRTSGAIVKRIQTRTGIVGVCCSPFGLGDKLLTNVMNVSFERANTCPVRDLAEFLS